MDQSRIYTKGGLLQITLESPGCTYAKSGHCKMCYYGSGQKIGIKEAVSAVERALMQFPEPSAILIGSFGSPLDEAEVDRDVLKAVLNKVAKNPVKNIYVETHCNTINAESLQFLKDNLPGKRITIEMGLESSNEEVLKNVINKVLNLDRMVSTIELIHSYGMSVALNVIYGLWYDKKAMQDDFIETCKWAHNKGADEIVAFIMNVKPGTYLEELFNQGKYTLPSHREFIATLYELSDDILSKMYFSWFGERQYRGERLDCIPPSYDGFEPEVTMSFYRKFMESENVRERRKLIADILNS